MYLTHRVPYPPDKGDRIRNFHVLRQLAARGPVWLGCLADEPVRPSDEAELHRLCERVAILPAGGKSRWLTAVLSLLKGRSLSEGLFSDRGLRQLVRTWAAETRFRAAVVSASSLCPYLERVELRATPKIVDLVDVDSQKWFDFASAVRAPRSWLYRLEGHRIRKLERGLPSWTQARSVVSRAEADVFESYAGQGTMTVAANGVDLEYFTPVDAPSEPTCAFVGALDYLPNVDAAVWFARSVWPAILAKRPEAKFQIIGRKPTSAVLELATIPGVELIGQVADVRPYLARAALAVIPLRLARGIQNKVLEALAMAKPVIAAPPALAALATVPGEHLLAATSPQEWVEAVCELLADPARCRKLGEAGRRFVETHHHWDRCLQPLMDPIFTPEAHRA